MDHSLRLKTPSLVDAGQATSTEVQKGWRRVLTVVRERGRVAVTNHGDVEAVVVSRQELERLDREIVELRAQVRTLSGDASPVDQLRERFLERLHRRDEGDFNARLRTAAKSPVKLGGRLKVGDRY